MPQQRYHLNPTTLSPGACNAQSDASCPWSGASNDENHYGTMAEAREASEAALAQRHGGVVPNRASTQEAMETNGGKPVGELSLEPTEAAWDTLVTERILQDDFAGAKLPDLVARERFLDDPSDPQNLQWARERVTGTMRTWELAKTRARIAREDFYARALEKGVPVSPEMDAALEAQWSDPENYFGEARSLENLAILQARVQDLAAGQDMTPVNDPEYGLLAEDLARTELEIRKTERLIATRGRSHILNVGFADAGARESVNRRLDQPTEEDIAKAEKDYLVQFSNRHGDWDRTMGAGTRRTAANEAIYWDRMRARVTKEDPGFTNAVTNAAQREANRNRYARGYEEGWVSPSSSFKDHEFEVDWAAGGEFEATKKLAEYEEMDRQFRDGSLPPSYIIGTGYRNPRKIARAYLDERLAETRRNVATRGRSDVEVLRRMRRNGQLPPDFDI